MTAMDRRDFMRLTTSAAGALVVEVTLPIGAVAAPAAAPSLVANAYLTIERTGKVTFVLDRAEMGQGVHTSLPMILCEELELAPEALTIIQAPADRRYANPMVAGLQITGGSTSVAVAYDVLRHAGAVVRELMLAAAAVELAVPKGQLTAKDGTVVHSATGRKRSYGELVPVALTLEPPSEPPLKDPKSFALIGKSRRRLDGRAKVTGTAGFGIDVQVPGLLNAYVLRAPTLAGTLLTVDTGDAVKAPGVVKIVPLRHGVAIVAKHFYQARAAATHLRATWSKGPLAGQSHGALVAELAAKSQALADSHADGGAFAAVLRQGGQVVQANYQTPFLAHAPMEPVNCTAHVEGDRVTVWAPTQSPGLAQMAAHQASGADLDDITIHTTFLGGGFGRRLHQDFVYEAVLIAKAVEHPVKVIWSREDDIRHDFYRPATAHSLRAALARDGRPLALVHGISSPSLEAAVVPTWVPAVLPEGLPDFVKNAGAAAAHLAIPLLGRDPFASEGARELPYDVGDHWVGYAPPTGDWQIPLGFWRSVGHSHTTFAVESFIDELAHAAQSDPLLYRRRLLAHKPDELRLLELLAEKSGWRSGEPPPRPLGRGLALHRCFGTLAGEVVFVRADAARRQLVIERVVAVIDVGLAINPSHVEAQVMSSIIFALSAALYGEVTIEQGAVQQSNFHDYPIARLPEVPRIEVHILSSHKPPSGAGEPAVPPLAPALANAIFAATGRRLRSLPLRPWG